MTFSEPCSMALGDVASLPDERTVVLTALTAQGVALLLGDVEPVTLELGFLRHDGLLWEVIGPAGEGSTTSSRSSGVATLRAVPDADAEVVRGHLGKPLDLLPHHVARFADGLSLKLVDARREQGAVCWALEAERSGQAERLSLSRASPKSECRIEDQTYAVELDVTKAESTPMRLLVTATQLGIRLGARVELPSRIPVDGPDGLRVEFEGVVDRHFVSGPPGKQTHGSSSHAIFHCSRGGREQDLRVDLLALEKGPCCYQVLGYMLTVHEATWGASSAVIQIDAR